MLDKKNDVSRNFFFRKMQLIVADDPEVFIISNRHKSIANEIAKFINMLIMVYARDTSIKLFKKTTIVEIA